MNIDRLLAPYEKDIEIEFALVLRNGQQYNHSYFVPERIVKKGREAVEEYILEKAFGDLIYVEISN